MLGGCMPRPRHGRRLRKRTSPQPPHFRSGPPTASLPATDVRPPHTSLPAPQAPPRPRPSGLPLAAAPLAPPSTPPCRPPIGSGPALPASHWLRPPPRSPPCQPPTGSGPAPVPALPFPIGRGPAGPALLPASHWIWPRPAGLPLAAAPSSAPAPAPFPALPLPIGCGSSGPAPSPPCRPPIGSGPVPFPALPASHWLRPLRPRPLPPLCRPPIGSGPALADSHWLRPPPRSPPSRSPLAPSRPALFPPCRPPIGCGPPPRSPPCRPPISPGPSGPALYPRPAGLPLDLAPPCRPPIGCGRPPCPRPVGRSVSQSVGGSGAMSGARDGNGNGNDRDGSGNGAGRFPSLRAPSLERYLSRHLPGFPARPAAPAPLTHDQFRSGQSNPTFYLKKGPKAYVLRKKPHGSLLPKAHKIDREFRVQKTLFSSGFPVPEPLLYCNDASVIGTEFYVMEHVEGRIFRDFTLPGVTPAERSALFVAAVETLARLHSLNVQTLDLEGFGRGVGYCKRQVSTWTEQYRATAHQDVPAMNQLSDWLMRNLPPYDNEERLIHGDFKLDNIIFHPKEARVVAVLDWELSTIGHPLADLAYLCMFYFWPKTFPVLDGKNVLSYEDIVGIPSMEELISIYCRCRDISPTLPNWNFFLVLSYFKLAGIAQGVYDRSVLGNSSAENSYLFGGAVKPLAEAGLQLSKNAAVPPTHTAEELFPRTKRGKAVLMKVKQFMKNHILPAEKEVMEFYTCNENSLDKWEHPVVIDKLKELAKAEGLWNLFLPAVSGLSQVDYALIAEETGKCFFAPDIFNCQAPDTGNMEVLHLYGSEEQKKQWLEPLLQGTIRSCFCMTEPDVGSSDASNMECSIERDGDGYVINGKKWWSSGAGNPKCKVAIVMGRNKNSASSRHQQHSMILVPLNTPGVKLIRPLSVFGYMDNIHGGHFEIHFNRVRVPASNLILGEGRGFEIAQGRLGPGRIHHCMRSIGLAERALQIVCERAAQRVTFQKKLHAHEVIAHWIAESRIAIEEVRLLTLKAAHSIDTVGSARAKKEIAVIKVAAPRAVCKVLDKAIQVCGGAGLSQDFPLANMYAVVRSLRIADGPDEVHLSAIAAMELRDQAKQLVAKM
ncbi:acyl-CoA dehydrogenase family member 11 [Tachyglossus aculeatus]|uniref:acyl-CoA dehydrogenase family member 11 n=1 Tax=Tachyglossus aculeatus TaxID=9261 RepID=UPI0018F6778F|nr:acyl-CoA dehydrogenase family member 11 [Tachyglossus aculeatus]